MTNRCRKIPRLDDINPTIAVTISHQASPKLTNEWAIEAAEKQLLYGYPLRVNYVLFWPSISSYDMGNYRNHYFDNLFWASFSEWINFGKCKLRIVSSLELYPGEIQKMYLGIELDPNSNVEVNCAWDVRIRQENEIQLNATCSHRIRCIRLYV